MKKYFSIVLVVFATIFAQAQTKFGVKIGYIDMDYILENVPDYKEASNLLEQKAQKWKQDIEGKKNEVTKLKDALKNERALLTKELIDEREQEIKFLENDLLDYQQKRFGPKGDLAIQKAAIIKPVQDQVFNAVQDIAQSKSYDFIFDKSSDLTMLFSAKKFDISDLVVRTITRAEKREEMSKKQRKALEEKEEQQDKALENNSSQAERQKIIDERKATAAKAQEERRSAAEQKKKEFEEKRKKLLEQQRAKKTGTTIDSTSVNKKQSETSNKVVDNKKALDSVKAARESERLKAIENNKKSFEERKKALEDKKKKILEEREAAKKAQADKLKQKNN